MYRIDVGRHKKSGYAFCDICKKSNSTIHYIFEGDQLKRIICTQCMIDACIEYKKGE